MDLGFDLGDVIANPIGATIITCGALILVGLVWPYGWSLFFAVVVSYVFTDFFVTLVTTPKTTSGEVFTLFGFEVESKGHGYFLFIGMIVVITALVSKLSSISGTLSESPDPIGFVVTFSILASVSVLCDLYLRYLPPLVLG
jgi:hypothetical protein